ncbi:MAG: isoaspartyl peptidase/L-asparaginase [Candidatus Thorarchaeota archaeon]|jgi:beta-aspartyl-peptidase (threonine type)
MIIVHGGAGNWKDERIPIGMDHVEKAARVGFSVFEKRGSALDAVEACTVFMESCGELNAGIGARENLDGVRELDAMIVDGSTLSFGSVAAVCDIQNPVSLARYIMEKTDYAFFAGGNANRIYEMMISEGYRVEKNPGEVKTPYKVDGADTVGCIAVDSDGKIAATSSTGGISKKLPGRVGDSPVMGAGAFANEICGATATGWGEHIMRVTLTRIAVLYVEQGLGIQVAADKAMDVFENKTGSEAGLVMADKEGNWSKATNAKAMPTTVIAGHLENIKSFIK